jgi:hypothetical protein
MSNKKPVKTSIISQLIAFFGSLLGIYKTTKLNGKKYRIHRRLHQEFEEKIESLMIMATMAGYKIEVKDYDLYQQNGKLKDSLVVNYRFEKSSSVGFAMEFKFNVFRKTLIRGYSHRLGDKSRQSFVHSRLKHHVTKKEDLAFIDNIIKEL